MLKILQVILVLFSFVIISPKLSHSADYYHDDFSSYNDERWLYNENYGKIVYSENGYVKLDSDTVLFPIVMSKDDNIFPDKDYVIDIRFGYDNVGDLGTGIGIGFTNTYGEFFYHMGVWADWGPNKLRFIYNDFSSPNQGACKNFQVADNLLGQQIVSIGTTANEGWHIMRIDKRDGVYSVSVDEVHVFTSLSNQCNPENIWFGNKANAGGNNWTELRIDDIRVYSEFDPNYEIKYIIIPGMGASWNTQAMVYGDVVGDDAWRMTPFVHNYDGLMRALESNHLYKNQNYYVWNYDWRQTLEHNVEKLSEFVNLKIGSSERVNVIGHSMGGLIARMWLQSGKDRDKIEKVFSLGAPQKGAIKAYRLWSGGSASDNPDYANIATEVLIQLKQAEGFNRSNIIRNFAPGLKDLIPTFDFVKREGRIISHNDLESINMYLNHTPPANIWPRFEAFGGIGVKTERYINIRSRNMLESSLGLWPDGVPVSYEYGEGDGTVLMQESATFSEDSGGFTLIESNHGEIVDKSLDMLMEKMGLNSLGVGTSVFDWNNKMIYYLGSPAAMDVRCGDNGSVSPDETGFAVANVVSGDICYLNIFGRGSGTYHLVAGRPDKKLWKYWQGNITTPDNISLRLSSNNADILNSTGNSTFLKRIISDDLLLLREKYPEDPTLARVNDEFLRNDFFNSFFDMFEFRRLNKEESISKRLINNLKELLVTYDGHRTIDQISSQGDISYTILSTTERLGRLNKSKGSTLDLERANNYSNGLEYLKEAKLDLASQDNKSVFWDYLASQEYLSEVW